MPLEPPPDYSSPLSWSDRLMWLEAALVLVVFFIHAAWPVPDVNEPHYLGKAIHFWDPNWVGDDFFLDSDDTHKVFYFSYGWLSLWLPPTAFAWVGRLITWSFLAIAWQRLSFALVPQRWWSILTAAILVTLLENAHMAGEWMIGGVEAKGFAYVFVLLGLEAMVRGRWNRTWLLLGAASLFHVLVGGWAVVAAGVAWLLSGRQRPSVLSMAPALIGGFVLSLPGLIPSLMLNRGADPETIRQAHAIYVFGRLSHHLAPSEFPPWYAARFAVLVAFWLLLRKSWVGSQRQHQLDGFIAGSLVIGLIGAIIGILGYFEPMLAAGWLRFYWFRLADIAVPIGVSTGLVAWILAHWHSRPQLVTLALAVALVLPGIYLGNMTLVRLRPAVPRADWGRVADYGSWRLACQWIAESGEVPPEARFLTPRLAQTFKWYTGHSEVATWKDIPQDPNSIVHWWRRICRLYGTGREPPFRRWYRSLARLGPDKLRALGKQYEASYVLTRSRPWLPLPEVYRNRNYAIYRLDGSGSANSHSSQRSRGTAPAAHEIERGPKPYEPGNSEAIGRETP